VSAKLPNEWRKEPLPSLVTNHDGTRIPVKAADRAKRRGSYPYYGASGVIDHIDEYLFDGEYLLIAEDGANLLSRSTPIAFTATGRFWVNNHAHIVQPREGISIRYLEYFLNTINLAPFVTGTAQPKLTQRALELIMVPVPPEEEQERIVAKLDDLLSSSKNAREELDHLPKLIDRLSKSVLGEAFGDEITQNWKPGTLKDHLQEGLIGLVRSKMEQRTAGPVPYIRMNHYDLEGQWNLSNLTYVTVSQDELARYELSAGDVLFNTRNSNELVGKVAIWPTDRCGYVYNNNLLRMRFKPCVRSDFAVLYMISPPFRAYLETVKSATTSVAAIYQRSLYNAPFPVPDLITQDKLVKSIRLALSRVESVAAERNRVEALLIRLDQAMLARAFRGELVITDFPSLEVAAAAAE
jgi:type I restriction enzyme S subunit